MASNCDEDDSDVPDSVNTRSRQHGMLASGPLQHGTPAPSPPELNGPIDVYDESELHGPFVFLAILGTCGTVPDNDIGKCILHPKVHRFLDRRAKQYELMNTATYIESYDAKGVYLLGFAVAEAWELSTWPFKPDALEIHCIMA